MGSLVYAKPGWRKAAFTASLGRLVYAARSLAKAVCQEPVMVKKNSCSRYRFFL